MGIIENIVVTNEVGSLPTGWTMYGDNLTNIDNFTQFGSGWVVSQVETANKAAASVSGNTASATCDRWLVTPAVALPDANQHLTFRVHAIDESAPEKLRIAVSVSGTDKSDFTTTLADYTFDGTNGTTAGWNTFGHTFTYTLPQGLRADKCYLVAFVANYGSSVTSGRKVINTVKSGYITADPGSPLSIADVESVTASVFPNPAANVVYISAGQTIHRVTVVNAMGSRVMDTGRASADMVELNVSTLAPGLYLVAVETASGTVVKKMSVAR